MRVLLLAACLALAWASQERDHELLQAVSTNDSARVKQLLKDGANPNAHFAHDFVSWTAVQLAARAGFVDIARILIESGAHPADYDKHGDTALHIAVREGHEEMVDLLLAKGLSPNTALKQGDATPLYIAARHPNMRILQALLRAKGDPNIVVGHDRGTSLHAAAREGLEEAVALLVQHGARVEALDAYQFTPLMVACSAGKHATVQRLLQLGANVNAQDHLGGTCLFRASQSGHTDTVATVLSHNPKLDITDVGGRTAKDVATGNLQHLFSEHEKKQRTVEALTKWLAANNMGDLLPQLTGAGIVSLRQLRETSEETLERLGVPPRRREHIHAELKRLDRHGEL